MTALPDVSDVMQGKIKRQRRAASARYRRKVARRKTAAASRRANRGR